MFIISNSTYYHQRPDPKTTWLLIRNQFLELSGLCGDRGIVFASKNSTVEPLLMNANIGVEARSQCGSYPLCSLFLGSTS